MRRVLSAVAALVASQAHAVVFAFGLLVLCVSVAQWSRPLAGSIAGITLMVVAAWPFVARRSAD